MKNLTVSFILIFISLLTAGNHPWPMWGHDVRHTNRTEMKGAIPKYNWQYEGGSYSPSSCIADILSNEWSISNGIYEDADLVSYVSFTHVYTSFYNFKSSKRKSFEEGVYTKEFDEHLKGSVYVSPFDIIYYTTLGADLNFHLIKSQINSQDSITIMNDCIGPFNGDITPFEDFLFITSRDEINDSKTVSLMKIDLDFSHIKIIDLENKTRISSVAVDKMGNAYAVTENNLYKINRNCEIVWIKPVRIYFHKLWEEFGKAYIMKSQAPLLSIKDYVIVNSESGVYAFNALDSNREWFYLTNDKGIACPAEDLEGNLYMVGEKSITALTSEGELIWRTTSFEPAAVPPTVDSEGKIYICSYDPECLFCFSKSGKILGTSVWKNYYSYSESNEYSSTYFLEKEQSYGQPQIIKNGLVFCQILGYVERSYNNRYEHENSIQRYGGLCFFDEKKGFSSSKTSRSLPEILRFTCSPNPFSSRLGISVNSPSSEVLQIYDISGRLVFRRNLEKGESRHFFSPSANGVYIIKIGNKTRKVVKIS
ncbi:MAG: T9SS type A sorting domain-containing protein [Candidatus Coatesbacteria bacterium]|nr:T9SS type A sorting domain-containing protein [Candidatus Coatesbacteria bacterium]